MSLPHVLFGTLRDHYILLFSAAGSFALVTGFIGAWVGARFGARAALRRGVADAAADLPNKAEVRGIAEGLDVLMVEVERITEGQRFVAKLLADRAALPAVPPAARREPGQITPH